MISKRQFVSTALSAMLGMPVGNLTAQNAQTLHLRSFVPEETKEPSSCMKGLNLALLASTSKIMVEHKNILFKQGHIVEAFVKAVNETPKPDVFILPPDETLIGLLEPIIESSKVPVIFPASLNALVEFESINHLYSMGSSARFLAQKSIEMMEQQLSVKKLYIIRESLSDLDLIWTTQFAKHLSQKSSIKIHKEFALSGADHLSKAIEEIEKMKPDLLFAAIPSSTLAQLMMQLKLKGLTTPIMTPVDRFVVNEVPAPDRVGHYLVSDFHLEDPKKRTRNFLSNYAKANEGLLPDREAALCYDAVLWLKQANLLVTKSTPMREALNQIKDLKGLMGPRHYSKDLGVMRNVYFSRTQAEGFRLIK